jgi:hypothetical protein
MKNVTVFGNENFKIIGSLNLKHILIMFQMMKVIRNQWRNLSPKMRLKKKLKNKSLVCINIFQPWLKIIQPCYNNLLKTMLYLEIWMLRLDIS